MFLFALVAAPPLLADGISVLQPFSTPTGGERPGTSENFFPRRERPPPRDEGATFSDGGGRRGGATTGASVLEVNLEDLPQEVNLEGLVPQEDDLEGLPQEDDIILAGDLDLPLEGDSILAGDLRREKNEETGSKQGSWRDRNSRNAFHEAQHPPDGILETISSFHEAHPPIETIVAAPLLGADGISGDHLRENTMELLYEEDSTFLARRTSTSASAAQIAKNGAAEEALKSSLGEEKPAIDYFGVKISSAWRIRDVTIVCLVLLFGAFFFTAAGYTKVPRTGSRATRNRFSVFRPALY